MNTLDPANAVLDETVAAGEPWMGLVEEPHLLAFLRTDRQHEDRENRMEIAIPV